MKAQMKREMIEIEYFTDPLCCWSWAFEPHWRRLLREYEGKIAWQYRMGGLLRDWSSYNDPVNSISRPAQMGPLWFQVRHTTQTEIDDKIWMEDPPASSYPACLAVKAAELQSAEAADVYLQRLRRAVMLQRRNIGKWEVLLEIAEEVLDGEKFREDYESAEAMEAFRGDLQHAAYREIRRFPTLVMRGGGRGLMMTGYRPYEMLGEAAASLFA
jgi:predicted DsbA family dithiol-disulfide isomerase